jgi:hypothetical protein
LALDPAGRMKPGWPWTAPSQTREQTLVVAADGTILVGLPDDDEAGYAFHRLATDGREVPGWPYRDEQARSCEDPLVGEDGTTYLACLHAEGGNWAILALDPGGRNVAGWPVRLSASPGGGSWWLDKLALGSDGTLLALAQPADGGGPGRLWAYAPDGRLRPGWPVTGYSDFAVAPGGRVLGIWYVPPADPQEGLCPEADATVLVELDRAGRTIAGWPRRAAGWADISVGADGTVYYLTRDRLYARAPDGSLLTGWPAVVANVYPECGSFGPYLAPDGTVYVMSDGLRALGPDGQSVIGWPNRPAGVFAGYACWTDTISATPPAIGPDGTVYVAVRPSSQEPGGREGPIDIVALDRAGRVLPGWPYRAPLQGGGEVDGMVVVGGLLHVTLTACESGRQTILALRPDGTLAD